MVLIPTPINNGDEWNSPIATEVARKVNTIDTTNYVTVGNTDGSYQTIQDAINANTGQSIGIYPGDYPENLVTDKSIKMFTIGLPGSVRINPASGVALTVNKPVGSAPIEVLIKEVDFITPTSAPSDKAAVFNWGINILFTCTMVTSPTTTYHDAVVVNTGAQLFPSNSRWLYSHTGVTPGSNIHRNLIVNGSGICQPGASNFTMTNTSDLDDNYCSVEVPAGSTGKFNMALGSFIGNFPAGFNGTATVICAENSTDTKTIQGAFVSYTGGGGGTGDCAYVRNTSGNPTEFESSSNVVRISGFNKNYFSVLAGDSQVKSFYDSISAPDFTTGDGEVIFANESSLSEVIPLSGVVDTPIIIGGANETVASGLVADYTTDFSPNGHHVGILMNSITTGGDITITGKAIPEGNGVPVDTTEVITVDTSTGQLYQSDLKWVFVDSVVLDVAITGANFDITKLGYMDRGNSDFRVSRYRIDSRSQSSPGTTSIRFQIWSVKDNGGKKATVAPFEDWTVTSGTTSTFTDNLRTAGDDRSYSVGTKIWEDDENFTYKITDFNKFFSSSLLNVFKGSSRNEGFYIQIVSVSQVEWLRYEMGVENI